MRRPVTSTACWTCWPTTWWSGPTAEARSERPLRPVVGPYRSSRFLLNVAKKLVGVPEETTLNGQPAMVFLDGGQVVAALVLDIRRRRSWVSGWCRTPRSWAG